MSYKSKVRKTLVPVVLMCCVPSVIFTQSVCRGKVAAADETTRAGANELVSGVENKPRKSIFGEVKDINGIALEGVFVEVFALSTKKGNTGNKNRMIASTTDEKGRFCFTKIPAGKYEVFYSMEGGWKHTSLLVKVAPNNRKSINQKLEVWMLVGT